MELFLTLQLYLDTTELFNIEILYLYSTELADLELFEYIEYFKIEMLWTIKQWTPSKVNCLKHN